VTRGIWVSLAIFVVVAIAAPLIGSTHIDLTRAWNGLSPDREILLYVRLPRVVLALIAAQRWRSPECYSSACCAIRSPNRTHWAFRVARRSAR